MKITDLSVKRPIFAIVINLLLLTFGIVAFSMLPLREFPDIDTPVVSVSGASANGGTLSTDGTPVIYTSAANYSGTDTFTYTVTSVV